MVANIQKLEGGHACLAEEKPLFAMRAFLFLPFTMVYAVALFFIMQSVSAWAMQEYGKAGADAVCKYWFAFGLLAWVSCFLLLCWSYDRLPPDQSRAWQWWRLVLACVFMLGLCLVCPAFEYRVASAVYFAGCGIGLRLI